MKWQRLTAAIVAVLVLLVGGLSTSTSAASAPAGIPDSTQAQTDAPSKDADVEALIRVLEDPSARGRLIEHLKSPAQASAQLPESEIDTVTTSLLTTISKRVERLARDMSAIATSLSALPAVGVWLHVKLGNPIERQAWLEVLQHLTIALGTGYLMLLLTTLALRRPRRILIERILNGLATRLLAASMRLLLDLLPVILFALSALGTLGLLESRETTRLIAIAWVNASVIVRVFHIVGRFLLAPDAVDLRLLPISAETAHYANIWLHRLTTIPIYGYIGLQIALLLGLPRSLYEALLRLLGLLIATLFIVLIAQNRHHGTAWLRRHEPLPAATSGFSALRRVLAGVWHILAILYIVVLYGIWALRLDDGFGLALRGTVLSALILIAGALFLHVLNFIFTHRAQVPTDLRERYPSLEERVNHYLPAVHTVTRGLVYVILFSALLQAWGIDAVDWLFFGPGRALTLMVAKVLVTVMILIAVWEAVSALIERHLAEVDHRGHLRVRSARAKTLLTVARNALLISMFVVGGLLVLAQLGVNIAPLLAGAGVLGLAVSFGSQKLVQDVITGALILFQDVMSVGDVVQLGEHSGVVEAISIRNVRLRDLSGIVHTIPFSAITTISNLTKDFSYYVFDVGVAYHEDTDRVMDVLRTLGQELQQEPAFGRLILEPIEILGVDAFSDSAVTIKARIKTLPIKQWDVGREFNRRMKKRFDELGIEIPFPHRTLYFAEPRGQTMPAQLQVELASQAGRTER